MSPNQKTDRIDCEELLDLIPEYAFGLSDLDQTRRIDASLERCPDAVAQLQDFRRLQDEMRASVAQIEPSAQLGERLMAAIAAPAIAAAAITPAPLPHVPIVEKPRRRYLRAAWIVAAAAVIALVATNVYWLTRVADLTQSQDLLAVLRNAQSSSAFVLTNTDALHWVRLADAQQQNNASAFMMWNSQSKTGLLYARNFPALQPGYIYHLWLTRDDKLVFAGVFQVDEKGDGALLFNSPEPINDFTWARITAQSQANSTGQPTGSPVVTGELNPT